MADFREHLIDISLTADELALLMMMLDEAVLQLRAEVSAEELTKPEYSNTLKRFTNLHRKIAAYGLINEIVTDDQDRKD